MFQLGFGKEQKKTTRQENAFLKIHDFNCVLPVHVLKLFLNCTFWNSKPKQNLSAIPKSS